MIGNGDDGTDAHQSEAPLILFIREGGGTSNRQKEGNQDRVAGAEMSFSPPSAFPVSVVGVGSEEGLQK